MDALNSGEVAVGSWMATVRSLADAFLRHSSEKGSEMWEELSLLFSGEKLQSRNSSKSVAHCMGPHLNIISLLPAPSSNGDNSLMAAGEPGD